MGTYRVRTSEDQVLGVIQAFSSDEGLGEVRIRRDGGIVEANAPAIPGWRKKRCTWVCKPERGTLTLSLRVRPPKWKMLGFYLAMPAVTMSGATMGCFLFAEGLDVLDEPFFFLALGTFIIGLFAYPVLGYARTISTTLELEQRFFRRLVACHPEPEHPPTADLFAPGLQFCLLIIPTSLLVAGAAWTLPTLAVMSIPLLLTLVIRSTTQLSSRGSPHVAWRLALTQWVTNRAVLCFPAFLALGLGLGSFSMISLMREGHPLLRHHLTEATRLHSLWFRQPCQGVLESNVLVFREALDTSPDLQVRDAKLAQTGYLLLCLFIFVWAMKTWWDWLRVWVLTKAGQKPTLSIPSIPGGGFRLPTFVRLSMLISFGLVAVASVFHLVLGVETTALLLTGRGIVNHGVGLGIGWLLIDLDAAACGHVRVDSLNAFLIMLMVSPALLLLVGWIPFALRSLLGQFWYSLTAPIDPALSNTLREFSLALRTRPPAVRLVRGELPHLETRVSWFYGRCTILVNQATVDTLNKQELKAVLAHEVAHIKHDAAALWWTRWLSFLSAFPCNVYAVLLDSDYREKRADAVAGSLLGDKDVVATALVKVSFSRGFRVGGRQSKPGERWATSKPSGPERRWNRLIDYLSLFAALLQPELVLGYTHPRLQDRLESLAENETSDTKTP